MCSFQIPLIHATVAPLLMPDYPTRMSISATMWLSPSLSHPTCYLQDRDEIADEVIIAQPQNRYVIIATVSLLPSRCHLAYPPPIYSRIHKSAFSGHKRLNSHSFCPRSRPCSRHFALSRVLYRPPMQGNSPAFQLDATVRTAFIPDSTLEFLPIFSRRKCTKTSIFSGFLRSLRWFDPRKLPRCFQA